MIITGTILRNRQALSKFAQRTKVAINNLVDRPLPPQGGSPAVVTGDLKTAKKDFKPKFYLAATAEELFNSEKLKSAPILHDLDTTNRELSNHLDVLQNETDYNKKAQYYQQNAGKINTLLSLAPESSKTADNQAGIFCNYTSIPEGSALYQTYLDLKTNITNNAIALQSIVQFL